MTATDQEATGRELATLPEKRGLHTGEPAYKQFDDQMIALIGKTLMPEKYATSELYYLLEMAATYRLDPFAREIWAARMTGRDGGGGAITILIGRDGLLAIAERHPDFRGFRNDVVYEKDEFVYDSDPRQLPDGTYSHVRHSYTSPAAAGRGKLLGAYAEVYREGRPPVFFFAPLEEYAKESDRPTPWKKQKSAMIRKCALANALRLAFRVSGLYIADEMSHALLERPAGELAPANGEVDYGDDPWQAQRLRDLFDAADSYLPAKRRLLLAGLDAAGRDELIARLEREIQDAGKELPPLPEEPEMETLEGEVVDDGIEFGEARPEPEPEEADITTAEGHDIVFGDARLDAEPGEQTALPADQ